MQFQHGTFSKEANGSLVLTPFGVDGRQLLSNPCKFKSSFYTRYEQPELFARYEVFTDTYKNIKRLNLYKFDGAPMNPMWLAYKPPQMLPTKTMNPTATATGAASATGKVKRGTAAEEESLPMNRHVLGKRRVAAGLIDAEKWWWVGVGMTALGGVGYLCF
jgi:hypothetical protein